MFACIFIQAFILVGPPHAMAASETDPKDARPRQAPGRATLDRGREGRAQTPGGRALLRAQGAKDLRSSFITFLLSDSNTDEALKKAVAHAMRHSPAQQGSAAYDKDRAERTWAAAVQVAGAFAARFA